MSQSMAKPRLEVKHPGLRNCALHHYIILFLITNVSACLLRKGQDHIFSLYFLQLWHSLGINELGSDLIISSCPLVQGKREVRDCHFFSSSAMEMKARGLSKLIFSKMVKVKVRSFSKMDQRKKVCQIGQEPKYQFLSHLLFFCGKIVPFISKY